MQIRLKQGFHGGSGGGNLNGWGVWWQRLSNAGYPVNAIMADTAGPLMEIQNGSSNPDDTLIYRFSINQNGFDPNVPVYTNNPEQEAERMILTKRSRWPMELDSSLVWLKDTNEVRTKVNDPNDVFYQNLAPGEWWGRYCLRAAELTVQRNERVILISPSSGDHTREFWIQPSMLDFLEYAAAHKNHIAIGTHEYSYTVDNILDPFTVETYENSNIEHRKVGRFELIFKICDEFSIDWPMLYFCEWGWEERNIPAVDKALDDIRIVTRLVYGPYYNYILGFGTWYLGPGFGEVHNQTNAILLPTADITLNESFNVEEKMPGGNDMSDCNAIVDVRTTSIWIPQFNSMTEEEIEQALSWARTGFPLQNGTMTNGNHMLCPSHVDALRIHSQGLPGSVLAVAYPHKIGSGVTRQWIQENCPCAFEDNKQVVFLGEQENNLFEFGCLPITTR